MWESPYVEHDFNNTNLVTKEKVENFHSQLNTTKQLLTSISVDIRIYLPLSDIHLGEYHFLG